MSRFVNIEDEIEIGDAGHGDIDFAEEVVSSEYGTQHTNDISAKSKFAGNPFVREHIEVLRAIENRIATLRDEGKKVVDAFFSEREALTPGAKMRERGYLGVRMKELGVAPYLYYDFVWFKFKFYGSKYRPVEFGRGRTNPYRQSTHKLFDDKTKPWEMDLFVKAENRLQELREEIAIQQEIRVLTLKAVRVAEKARR